MQVSNYEGYVFGHLLVRLDLGRILNNSKTRKERMVLAECLKCSSNIKRYQIGNIKSGTTKSCGCFRKENSAKKVFKHGKSKTSTYMIWENMKKRCGNPNATQYKDYGGRGITVCDRWVNSFENFLADMGECPPNTQIDRINNNLGYSPENCHWVTSSENNFNKRRQTNNKSGKTGVSWVKTHKKWVAKIYFQGNGKHLGFFENLEDAIEARKQAELNLFGFTKD